MKYQMLMRMIYGALKRRTSRIFIALLSIVCGSLIIFGMLTIYLDIPKQFNEEFRSYGANLVLMPKDGEGMSQEELDAVHADLSKEGMHTWTPYQYEAVQINHQNFIVSAADFTQVKDSHPYWLVDGQWPQGDGDILIGADVAETIQAKIGDNISLEAVDTTQKEGYYFKKNTGTYHVAGIVHTGGKEEESIFIAPSQIPKLYPHKSGFDIVECGVEGNHEQLTNLSESLAKAHPFLLARPAQRLTKSQDLILDKLTRLVWMIVIIMSSLTAISIMTTMYAIVYERTNEIGLKKAIGASDGEIIFEFMAESFTMALLGSLVGCFLGYYFAQFIAKAIFARHVHYNPWVIIPVCLLMMAITALACYLPVRKTAEISPDIVLRGE